MKVVINKCFGGFGLSHAAKMRYAEISGFELYVNNSQPYLPMYYKLPDFDDDSYFSTYDIERTDPVLVQVVEEMGSAANGEYARLTVVEIPDGIKWYIDEYDGIETIHEKHQAWG